MGAPRKARRRRLDDSGGAVATAEDTTSVELPAAALARPGFWGRPPAERAAVFAAMRRSRLTHRVGTGA
ncbi:MAG TPA: hypothetical protein VK935_21865, partial [Actinomycetospora sp.]|nr:hypothetical protein [Actinomycetospora sp.]